MDVITYSCWYKRLIHVSERGPKSVNKVITRINTFEHVIILNRVRN